MTDLHWALIAIAGFLLLAVFVYSRWQERRELARFETELRRGVGDPLAERGVRATGGALPRRIEPRLDTPMAETIPAAVAAVATAAAPVDEFAPTMPLGERRTEPEADRAEPSAYALPDGWIEDPLLDFVIELRCTHAIDGVAALEARSQLDRLQLPLPARLAVWDAKTQQWTAPDRFGFYSEILLAVQLAHRGGALGEIDAARFVSAAQQIALAVDADFDAPEARRLVSQAAELDKLCARFDVLITLTVQANGAPWSADTIQAAATVLGFSPTAAGRWELREGEHLVLVLTAPAQPADHLALSIDVPLVRPETSPLARQFAVADQLAARLDARVIDDNGRPVQREAHFAVAAQLATLYEDMQAAGLAAGSERAQRLYAG
jgi:hypothetical protein